MPITNEPIAIIGLACRLPGGVDSAESFWQFLKNGESGVVPVPEDRWSAKKYYDPKPDKLGRARVCQAGFLTDPIDRLDGNFFGISPREGAQMDPQQRLLLEVTWEALEQAGLPPDQLKGSETGVYVGGFLLDNLVSQLSPLNRSHLNTHTATSSTMAMLSNRLSYTFDFHGPSVSVDTACSASLTCLHLACQGLRSGDCELALTAGVNIMLRPESVIAMSKGGFLSPDGKCKTFDESADGYGRGEGAGVLVIKRLSDAQRDGDTIHSLILATGVNQDGRTSGITLPNSQAQEKLLRRVLAKASVKASDIAFAEAHGTGTKAGDKAEVRSLNAVLSQERAPDSKVWVGAVKTNVGHLEAAAGVVSVIKTALVLRHQQVPPNLHHEKTNPQLELESTVLQTPDRVHDLPPSERPKLACVSAFGYGGSNACAVMQEAPLPIAKPASEEASLELFPLSAACPESLKQRARDLAQHLVKNPQVKACDLAHTLARRRTHLEHRALLEGGEKLVDTLKALAEDQASDNILATGSAATTRSLVFLYNGMGSQWFGMGCELMDSEPLFAASMNRCDKIWQDLSGTSLLSSKNSGEPMLDPIDAQPAQLALQVSLTELWRSRGVKADAVLGHSVGEVAAAWAAGVLSLEDAFRLSHQRCRLQQRLAGTGTMLYVACPRDSLAQLPSLVDIAAINDSHSVVLSGPREELQHLAEQLQKRAIFHRFLKVSVPYHSRAMDQLKVEFMDSLRGLQMGDTTVPLYSSVTGQLVSQAEQNLDYWWQNVRQTVQFHKATQSLAAAGFDYYLEIGPHPVLGPSVELASASMRRGEPERSTLQRTLGELFCRGVGLDWTHLAPEGELVSLPNYPWQREQVWNESPAALLDRLGQTGHSLLQRQELQPDSIWEGELNTHWLPYLKDHKVGGQLLFPGAGFVEMALLHAAAEAGLDETLVVENLQFLKPLNPESSPFVRLFPGTQGRFQLCSAAEPHASHWTKNCTGRVSSAPYPQPDRVDIQVPTDAPVDLERFYQELKALDLEYGPSFRCLKELWQQENRVLGKVKLNPNLGTEDDILHPCLLDACFHALFAASPAKGLSIPVSVQTVRRYTGALPQELFFRGVIETSDSTEILANLTLCDLQGTVVAEVSSLRLQVIGQPEHTLETPHCAYTPEWKLAETEPASEHSEKTVTFLNETDSKLVEALLSKGWKPQSNLAEADHLVLAGYRNKDADFGACHELLDWVQKFGSRAQRVILVTDRCQQATGKDRIENPAQAALWGMARVLAQEYPHLKVCAIDVCTADPDWIPSLATEIASESAESEVALRGSSRYIQRLEKHQTTQAVPSSPLHSFALKSGSEGTFEHLRFEQFQRTPPAVGELEIAIHTSAINFKDVMKVLNLLPDSYLKETFFGQDLGMECAGIVTALGDGITEFQLGDKVAAVGRAGLGSHTTVPAYCTVPLPLNFELSVQHLNFLTAYRGLVEIAQVRSGETVLIHGGAGGVGLAALQFAKAAGAKVIATAGTPEKRRYLTEMGADWVSDSRSLAFYDHSLEWTEGRGVDVILNSLSGEFMRKSLQLLSPSGRFIEIGKRDIAEAEWLDLKNFSRNQLFAAIDVDIMIKDDPKLFHRLIHKVRDLLNTGAVKPLPSKLYPASETATALRFMGRSEHIGKVVVKMDQECVPLHLAPRDVPISEEHIYLVTGGFGGFGLEVCYWLQQQGCHHLAICSRSGPTSGKAQRFVKEFEKMGGSLLDIRVDVGDSEALKQALSGVNLQRLKGVVHCAGHLRDGPLSIMPETDLQAVLESKASGAWNLHQLTQHCELDIFILFSSVSALLGNRGQANYAAANAFLDSLAHHRRALGQHGLSLNWGPISQVGMVADNVLVQEYLQSLGFHSLPVALALDTMEWALKSNCTQVAIVEADWSKYPPSLNSSLVMNLTNSLDSALPNERQNQLLQSPPEQRQALAEEFLIEQVSRVLRLSTDKLDSKTALARLGVDSLMTVELMNSIRLELGVELPALAFQSATLGELAAQLCEKLSADDEILNRVDDMDEAELDRLLSELTEGNHKVPSAFLE